MKTIKEITEMAEKITQIEEVAEVVVESDKLKITLINKEDDEEYYNNWVNFEKKLIEKTGELPTPCDVNKNDWFIYF